MINDINRYREAGEKAGRAMRQHDIARANAEHNWFLAACALEHPADRVTASVAYGTAYREQATPTV